MAWAARALARRLITVLFVGVMDVLGPPASSGLFLPAFDTDVIAKLAVTVEAMPLVGDSWSLLEFVELEVVSLFGVVATAKTKGPQMSEHLKIIWGKTFWKRPQCVLFWNDVLPQIAFCVRR